LTPPPKMKPKSTAEQAALTAEAFEFGEQFLCGFILEGGCGCSICLAWTDDNDLPIEDIAAIERNRTLDDGLTAATRTL